MTKRRKIASVAASAIIATVAVVAFTVSKAYATNTFGPGVGTQNPYGYWGGAYILTGVSGDAFCISPGAASPPQIPNAQYVPGTYTGANPAGMSYLMYFDMTFSGGYASYTANDVAGAVAEIAYSNAGGTPAAGGETPATQALASTVQGLMANYPGPWSINVTMPTPPSGGYYVDTNYTGTVTVSAANGAGVPGLALTAPTTGGPGELANFVFGSSVTDSSGSMGFTFNVTNVGAFSGSIGVVGGAPASLPPEYNAPAGSGGQNVLVSGTTGNIAAPLNGTAQATAGAVGSIQKTNSDSSYVSDAGATFQIINSFGTDTSNGANYVEQSLTTNSAGDAGPSIQLPAGPYALHESVAPAGLNPAPDQTITIQAGATITVSINDSVQTGNIKILKTSSATGTPLPNASFTVAFSPKNDGNYTQQISGPGAGGVFTTDSTGYVQDPNGVLNNLMPGKYQVTETTAPAGYAIAPPYVATVSANSTTTATVTDKTVSQITTTATQMANTGGAISDTANFSGSAGASGTLVFSVYGPYTSLTQVNGATACSGTPAFTGANIQVSGASGKYTSQTYTPSSVGYYVWQVAYSGDTNNTPLTLCGGTNEYSTVVQVSTSATPTASVGSALQDTATVKAPTDFKGVLGFDAYGPFNAPSTSCTTPVFASKNVAVSGPGVYKMSDSFAPSKPGLYQWVESLNNNSTSNTATARGTCGASNESSAVVSVTTTGGAVVQGTPVYDTITVAGDVTASSKALVGSTLYSVSDKSCSNPIWNSPAVAVSGPGTYKTPSYTGSLPAGTYQWVETFVENSVVVAKGACNTSVEYEYVNAPPPPVPAPPAPLSPPVPVTG